MKTNLFLLLSFLALGGCLVIDDGNDTGYYAPRYYSAGPSYVPRYYAPGQYGVGLGVAPRYRRSYYNYGGYDDDRRYVHPRRYYDE